MKFIGGALIGMSILIFMVFNYVLNNYGYNIGTWMLGIIGCITLGVGFVNVLADENGGKDEK